MLCNVHICTYLKKKCIICYSEQCHNLISGIYKTSCKTGEGIHEMFEDIAQHLVEANRSRMELHEMDKDRFKISYIDEAADPSCLC